MFSGSTRSLPYEGVKVSCTYIITGRITNCSIFRPCCKIVACFITYCRISITRCIGSTGRTTDKCIITCSGVIVTCIFTNKGIVISIRIFFTCFFPYKGIIMASCITKPRLTTNKCIITCSGGGVIITGTSSNKCIIRTGCVCSTCLIAYKSIIIGRSVALTGIVAIKYFI